MQLFVCWDHATAAVWAAQAGLIPLLTTSILAARGGSQTSLLTVAPEKKACEQLMTTVCEDVVMPWEAFIALDQTDLAQMLAMVKFGERVTLRHLYKQARQDQ